MQSMLSQGCVTTVHFQMRLKKWMPLVCFSEFSPKEYNPLLIVCYFILCINDIGVASFLFVVSTYAISVCSFHVAYYILSMRIYTLCV